MRAGERDELISLIVIGLVFALIHYRPRWRPGGKAFGTARLAADSDLKAAGMLSERGLILGRSRTTGKLIRISPATVHLSVFAPTGAGKGVSLIVPWLRTYPGACIVLDPKGELFRLSAERRREMGQRVYRLDPFEVCGPGADTWNPLDVVTTSGMDCVENARVFGESLVIRSPEGERDSHWQDQGANVLTSIFCLVLGRLSAHERTLSSVRELVTDPAAYESAALLLNEMGGVFSRLGGVLAQLARTEKEGASVLSVVHRHTTVLDTPAILASTSTSTFPARELLEGNVTVYLILPPYQLEAQARWLRLIITALTRLIGREGMQPGKECLFLLDEAGTALGGHMPAIEQGLTLLRSYGLKMAFFFQSLGQLRETFRGKEAILLDNTDQIYFGVQSFETAERVSKMLGESTSTLTSASSNESRSWQTGIGNQGGGTQVNHTYGQSWSEHGRFILKPEEVLSLNGNLLVAFLRGVRPILARRVLWYADPFFSNRWSRPLSVASPVVTWALAAGAAGLIAWAVLGSK